MPAQATTRPLTAADGELLRTATLANVNWSGEQRFTARDVDERADLRCYTVFRPGRGDLGFVAERAGRVVAWSGRSSGAEDPGHGFVADGVPELGLCVWSGYRGEGIGGRLLRQALAEARRRGVRQVSLSVEAGNPSVRLYRAAGFTPVPGAAAGTMAVDL